MEKKIQEKKYEITQTQLNGIIAYLQKQPFEQVYQGMTMLTTLKEIPVVDKKE